MSNKASLDSARAGVHMQSPKTFLTKMELPAPINVIFGIITSVSYTHLEEEGAQAVQEAAPEEKSEEENQE